MGKFNWVSDRRLDSQIILKLIPTGIFALLVALLLTLPARGEKVEQLEPQGYVNDFAGILPAQTKAQIDALCAEVDRKTRAQIALVTVRTLEGLPVEEFANKLFERWGIGYKGDDRGVLILLAQADHKYWIEVGYRLEPILPDGKVGGFGREMLPMLRRHDYGGALLHLTQRIAEVITSPPRDSRKTSPERSNKLFGLVIVLVVLLVWGAYELVRRSRRKRRDKDVDGDVRRSRRKRRDKDVDGDLDGGWWGGGGFGGGEDFSGFGGGVSGGGGAGGSWFEDLLSDIDFDFD